MPFYGYEFLFNGKSCREFGLMVYSIGSDSQKDVKFPSGGTIHEERVAGRTTSLFYGLEQNEALEFTLVFGVNMRSINKHSHLDRWDIEAISAWLTGHNEQKWLEIVQPDMETIRYKCIISELHTISNGGEPWAFSCTVTCNSPFGYTYPYKYHINGTTPVHVHNRSTYNGYYKPKIILTLSQSTGTKNVSLINQSDSGREFAFTGLPSSVKEIEVDNENQIITDRTGGLNLYPYFNFKFFQLVRGDNILTLTNNCEVDIICEFPANIGG